ncbi:MAG TPA: DUF5668 domain-containing protein [Bryobacteraceae bacterium]|nr:DUF5668 domain-containing protein [Bryobacteraceae bacterium]
MRRCCYRRDRYFAWNGVVLLGLGVVLLLDRLGIVSIWEIVRFWPVVLVAGGTVLLVELASLAARTVGAVLIAGGLLLQASSLGYIQIRGGVWGPLALIALGVILLGRALEERNRPPAPPEPEPEPEPFSHRPDFGERFWNGAEKFRARAERFARNLESNFSEFGHGPDGNGEHVAVFSHVERRIVDQNLEKLKVVAVFGGFELDLRGASISGDQAWLEADAVFGGIEIYVPEDWQVIPRGAGVFGGFTDESQPPAVPMKKLIVSGAGVFGGVLITNQPGFWNRRSMRRLTRRERSRDWQYRD